MPRSAQENFEYNTFKTEYRDWKRKITEEGEEEKQEEKQEENLEKCVKSVIKRAAEKRELRGEDN